MILDNPESLIEARALTILLVFEPSHHAKLIFKFPSGVIIALTPLSTPGLPLEAPSVNKTFVLKCLSQEMSSFSSILISQEFPALWLGMAKGRLGDKL